MTSTVRHARPVVERYSYTRVYDRLFPAFVERYANEQARFEDCLASLCVLPTYEILTRLGVETPPLSVETDCTQEAMDNLNSVEVRFAPFEKVGALIAALSAVELGIEGLSMNAESFRVLAYLL
mgnify:CR=1 FL=1